MPTKLIWNASASAPIGRYTVAPADRLDVPELVAVDPPEVLATFLAARGHVPEGRDECGRLAHSRRLHCRPGQRSVRSRTRGCGRGTRDEDGPEVGAGWKHTCDRAGAFISVVLDDPVFAHPVRARLFQSDENGRDWGLHWTRQKKREEQE